MRVLHVPSLDDQQFGAAAADFADDRRRFGEPRFGRQQRLDAAVRHSMHLGLVHWLDGESRRDVDAIDERQLVQRLADCARRDHPHLVEMPDAVLFQLATVRPQHPGAVFNRLLADLAFGERVLPQADPLRQRFQRPHPSGGVDFRDRHADRRGADVDHRHRPRRVPRPAGRRRRFMRQHRIGHALELRCTRTRNPVSSRNRVSNDRVSRPRLLRPACVSPMLRPPVRRRRPPVRMPPPGTCP